MDHEKQRAIYSSDARRYDALVSAEDCDGNLLPALTRLAPARGATVVDVGTGTGRLARLWAGAGALVAAADRERAMLAVARDRLPEPRLIVAATVDALPFRSGHFDLACAGWVFGHFPHWRPDSWRPRITTALAEMTRLVRPGGAVVVLETLGTAVESPAPPNRSLAEYYGWLEDMHGFRREILSTDYLFASVDEAAALCGFFFGPAYRDRVRAGRRARVSEFTGLWWRRNPAP